MHLWNISNALAFVTRRLIGQRQKFLRYIVGYSLTSLITFHVKVHGFILLATLQFEAKLHKCIRMGITEFRNTRKHHMQESQEVSPFPAGGHWAAMNRQESMTITRNINCKNDPQKKHCLGTVSKNSFTWGLKLVLWYQPDPLFLMWINTNRCLVRMYHPSKYKSIYKKEIKQS